MLRKYTNRKIWWFRHNIDGVQWGFLLPTPSSPNIFSIWFKPSRLFWTRNLRFWSGRVKPRVFKIQIRNKNSLNPRNSEDNMNYLEVMTECRNVQLLYFLIKDRARYSFEFTLTTKHFYSFLSYVFFVLCTDFCDAEMTFGMNSHCHSPLTTQSLQRNPSACNCFISFH